MQNGKPYQPDWITEKDVRDWLKISRTTLWKWKKEGRVAYTKVAGGKTMYDRKQINEMLNENSTYKYLGLKLTTA